MLRESSNSMYFEHFKLFSSNKSKYMELEDSRSIHTSSLMSIACNCMSNEVTQSQIFEKRNQLEHISGLFSPKTRLQNTVIVEANCVKFWSFWSFPACSVPSSTYKCMPFESHLLKFWRNKSKMNSFQASSAQKPDCKTPRLSKQTA
jgi:hypothetical protein